QFSIYYIIPMTTVTPAKFKDAVLEDYKPFQYIERTLHFDDYTNKNDEAFTLSVMSSRDKTFLSKNIKVLWFLVSSPDNKHHFYGNVSFSISIEKLLKHFCSKLDYRLYWVETVLWPKSIDSRIMLTKNNMPNSLGSMGCPMNEIGYPIYQDDSGKFYELKNIIGTQYTQKKHEVEFLIEATEEECSWLYQNCECRPVDHSEANTRFEDGRYLLRVCHKYNTIRGETCPTPYGIKETETIMKNINIRNVLHQRSIPVCDDNNKTDLTTRQDPLENFDPHGTVVKSTIENFGFVHMGKALKAIDVPKERVINGK
ncbi:unnamed protein product, partial [Meganyctiphanes norvegica]